MAGNNVLMQNLSLSVDGTDSLHFLDGTDTGKTAKFVFADAGTRTNDTTSITIPDSASVTLGTATSITADNIDAGVAPVNITTSSNNDNITIDPNGSGTLALGSADNTAVTIDAIAFSIDAAGGASNIT